jgi:hypothetical protein
MIFESLFSLLLVWLFPYVFCLFNPFYLPISSLLTKRKIVEGCLFAYITGLSRDIFLATPVFGVFGLSACIATACTAIILLNVSLDGFLGSIVISFFLVFFDMVVIYILNFFLSTHLFFSWKMFFFTLFLTVSWQVSMHIFFSRFLFLRRFS